MRKFVVLFCCLIVVGSALTWKTLGHADALYVHSNTVRAESFNQIWLGNAFFESVVYYDISQQSTLFLKGTLGYQIKWGISPIVQYEWATWGLENFRAGVRWCYYFGGEL